MTDFEIMEHNRQIDTLIEWVEADGHFPTGIEVFDMTWTAIRSDQPTKPAKDCLLLRRLVSLYKDVLPCSQ